MLVDVRVLVQNVVDLYTADTDDDVIAQSSVSDFQSTVSYNI